MVQRLGLIAVTARGLDLIPGGGTEVPQAVPQYHTHTYKIWYMYAMAVIKKQRHHFASKSPYSQS